MSRIVTGLVALAIFLPNTAFACGMYIPPEREKKVMLAELLDEIDSATPEAPVVAQTEPTQVEQPVEVEIAVQPDVVDVEPAVTDAEEAPAPEVKSRRIFKRSHDNS